MKNYQEKVASGNVNSHEGLLRYLEALNQIEWQTLIHDMALAPNDVRAILRPSPTQDVVTFLMPFLRQASRDTKRLAAAAVIHVCADALRMRTNEREEILDIALALMMMLGTEVGESTLRAIIENTSIKRELRVRASRLYATYAATINNLDYWKRIDFHSSPFLLAAAVSALAIPTPEQALELLKHNTPDAITELEIPIEQAVRSLLARPAGWSSLNSSLNTLPQWANALVRQCQAYRSVQSGTRNNSDTDNDTANSNATNHELRPIEHPIFSKHVMGIIERRMQTSVDDAELVEVIVICDKVDRPHNALHEAVKHNLTNRVRYTFVVSSTRAQNERELFFSDFVSTANVVALETNDPEARSRVRILSLPTSWENVPFIFYRLRSKIDGKTHVIGFQGNEPLVGIANAYEPLNKATAKAIYQSIFGSPPSELSDQESHAWSDLQSLKNGQFEEGRAAFQTFITSTGIPDERKSLQFTN